MKTTIKRLLAAMLVLSLLCAALPLAAVAASDDFVIDGSALVAPAKSISASFTDIPSDAYYKDAVSWAIDQKITVGIGNGLFNPNGGLTRSQVVTFLWRYDGEKHSSVPNPFRDVSTDSYYYDAVLWAVEKGITSGTSATTFHPDKICTRAEIVTFLWRYFEQPYVRYGIFSDVKSYDWFAVAVSWATKAGITMGQTSSLFAPNSPCTRAQGVTFLHRAENMTLVVDNDKTGYVPNNWSWKKEGTEGYGLPCFTSGKYVRKDGRAVLYIESSSSSDFFDFQLYVMADGGKDAWYRPNEWDEGDYLSMDWQSETKATNYLEFFEDIGDHTIRIRNEYEDSMSLYYSMPDGDYVLVREK